MTAPASSTAPRPEPGPGKGRVGGNPEVSASRAAGGAPDVPSVDAPVPVDQLSPEEQMARFERELKEKDWGHQPC